MECEYQIKGTTLRIFLPQELDHHVSARLREEADLMVETHFISTIIFDFSGTDWMDSSGFPYPKMPDSWRFHTLDMKRSSWC